MSLHLFTPALCSPACANGGRCEYDPSTKKTFCDCSQLQGWTGEACEKGTWVLISMGFF